jgi:glycine/D-amino acid oxidase-like deaminating enzyme
MQPDVRVHSVVRRGGRAAGAQTSAGLVTAEHVWVCAGAIGTPALLQRSGIRRHVGGTLQMHPTIKLVARFDEPLIDISEVPVHQVKPPGTALSFGGSASRPGLVALALVDDWAGQPRYRRRLAILRGLLRSDPARGTRSGRRGAGARGPLVTYALTRGDLRLLGHGWSSWPG